MLWKIKVFGIVQGVGFRPFISRLADAFFICGNVANKGSYVEIFAQGTDVNLRDFVEAIRNQSPPRATILNIEVTEFDSDKIFNCFKIINSIHEHGDIFVSPDIAVCEQCRAELFDLNDRRYLHPFINCTDCGPRLTILKNMPYDRERTCMSDFPMCDRCAKEYINPSSRRYDAQPICCNECGPEVYIVNGSERGGEAIRKVRNILKIGGIAAIKGIGGFHLACDAKNHSAVQRLRESKKRPTKPFAVMFKDIDIVNREYKLNDAQLEYLDSPQKPIILLNKKITTIIADNVAPKINRIGVMLPYTPLHLLIFDYPDDIENFPDALVMTSGNPSGVPIAITDKDAINSFGKFCDVILSHNRKILIRADDSVMDFINENPSMVRRSRGYAPLPIFYKTNTIKSILAIGGELKNTFCLAKNNLFYLSPYIGDMSDMRTVDILKNSTRRMCDLLEITPDVIACDTHPRYHTVKVAEEIANAQNIPVIKIQHHYAHILSCMAENDYHDEVIGIAFDGTGYGDDGTIWGGEVFICDTEIYQRVGHIAKFIQAGGDFSSREAWRSAVSMMAKLSNLRDIAVKLNLADEESINSQILLLNRKFNYIDSTSCGRLFDAVSAILGICTHSTYEGQAAMELQAVAENTPATQIKFAFNIADDIIIPTDELFNKILDMKLNGIDSAVSARFFHEQLAEMIAETCQKLKFSTGITTVALSGGVFQNSLLTSLTINKLNYRNFKVLVHKMIPTNDGGICLGQAVHALCK